MVYSGRDSGESRQMRGASDANVRFRSDRLVTLKRRALVPSSERAASAVIARSEEVIRIGVNGSVREVEVLNPPSWLADGLGEPPWGLYAANAVCDACYQHGDHRFVCPVDGWTRCVPCYRGWFSTYVRTSATVGAAAVAAYSASAF